MSPAGLQEKGRVPGRAPGLHFMRIPGDPRVGGNDHPIEFFGQAAHPGFVGDVRSKLFLEVDDLMLGSDQDVEASRQARREIVIEEESHAAFASEASNSPASRTSAC